MNKAADAREFRTLFAETTIAMRSLVGNATEVTKEVARLGGQLDVNAENLDAQLELLKESVDASVSLDAKDEDVDAIIERVRTRLASSLNTTVTHRTQIEAEEMLPRVPVKREGVTDEDLEARLHNLRSS